MSDHLVFRAILLVIVNDHEEEKKMSDSSSKSPKPGSSPGVAKSPQGSQRPKDNGKLVVHGLRENVRHQEKKSKK